MTREDLISAAYAVAALITFAWSASDPAHKCPTDEPPECFETLGRMSSGFFAGLVWPAYWAWTGAEHLRGQHHGD